jgi:hypothetical protein
LCRLSTKRFSPNHPTIVRCAACQCGGFLRGAFRRHAAVTRGRA